MIKCMKAADPTGTALKDGSVLCRSRIGCKQLRYAEGQGCIDCKPHRRIVHVV